jgi:enoyl-CoA hydratase/carnithine racemase
MSDLLIERDGPVMRLTINREERRNAITDAVIDGIMDGIRQAMDAGPDVRAILLTGKGDRAFCAGADLKRAGKDRPFQIDHTDPAAKIGDLFRLVERCPLPLVARVNGHAVAGGLGLVAMCDMAISVDTAKFGAPESRIGVWPMMIMTHLMRVMPKRKLLELMVTGEPISADEALGAGLLNHVVTAGYLDAKTDWLLDCILKSSPTAIRRGLYVYRAMQDMTMHQALVLAESNGGLMGTSEDAKEGIASFNEKRSPEWPGL